MAKAAAEKERKEKEAGPRQVDTDPVSMFFAYNTQLGPPYHILIVGYVCASDWCMFSALVPVWRGHLTVLVVA